jgi:hypothetical protein
MPSFGFFGVQTNALGLMARFANEAQRIEDAGQNMMDRIAKVGQHNVRRWATAAGETPPTHPSLLGRRTGNYHDSILTRPARRVGNGWESAVYTDSPYALRSEFGFFGTDRIGRTFAQPPRPHWKPGIDETWIEGQEIINSVAGKLFGEG